MLSTRIPSVKLQMSHPVFRILRCAGTRRDPSRATLQSKTKPFRHTFSASTSPTWWNALALFMASKPTATLPSIHMITSSDWSPAHAAGPPASTLVTRMPDEG